MKVDIVDQINYLDPEREKVLTNQANRILESLDLPSNRELCITFVDDRTIRDLNRTYRGKDSATDVLSFPQDGPAENLLGDVVISVETAERQAEEFEISTKDEIEKLVVHGILHLLGYDHMEEEEANIMREKEEELVALIRDVN